jgi:hypothetical protein
MLLSQSGAEATILTSLTRSWKMIASQTDTLRAGRRKPPIRDKDLRGKNNLAEFVRCDNPHR